MLLRFLHRSICSVTGRPAVTVEGLGIHVSDGVGLSTPKPYQRLPATRQTV